MLLLRVQTIECGRSNSSVGLIRGEVPCTDCAGALLVARCHVHTPAAGSARAAARGPPTPLTRRPATVFVTMQARIPHHIARRVLLRRPTAAAASHALVWSRATVLLEEQQPVTAPAPGVSASSAAGSARSVHTTTLRVGSKVVTPAPQADSPPQPMATAAALGAIPNPRHVPMREEPGWVSDVAQCFRPGTVEQVNEIIEGLNVDMNVEAAVVTVTPTCLPPGEDLSSFAVHLFNHWGIGDADTNNGMLVRCYVVRTGFALVLRVARQRVLRLLLLCVWACFVVSWLLFFGACGWGGRR